MDDGRTTNGDQATGAFFDAGRLFGSMWADFASKMAASSTAFSPDQDPPEAARQVRTAFLKAWGEYCEQFMRSPEFLATVKHSLNSAIDLRKQLNEFLGRVHHEFQGTSRQDVDQLMLAMRHLEQRMTDEFTRLSSRLAVLEEALLRSKPAGKRPAKAKRKGRGGTSAERKKAKRKAGKKRSG